MRGLTRMVVGLACVSFVVGCRAAAQVVEVPRVDLGLAGGNRGYLVGTPPAAADLKTTRQMVEATVEVPSLYKAKRSGAPVSLEGIAPPEREPITGEAPVVSGPVEDEGITYKK